MIKREKRIITTILSVILVTSFLLAIGCSSPQDTSAESKYKKSFISPEQAAALIKQNENNQKFKIIDDRPKVDYDSGHIANAVNIQLDSDFQTNIYKLDKENTYLVYCPTGCGLTSKIMIDLGFKTVFEIKGGLNAWRSLSLPITQNTVEPAKLNKSFISPEQASALIKEQQNNPNFKIIDDRPKSEYDAGHITGAINIQSDADFKDNINKLDKNMTYLVYCPTGCGYTSQVMTELGFKTVYEITGGINAWKALALPIEK